METNVNALLKKNEPHQRKKLKKTMLVEVKKEQKENYFKNKSSFFDSSLSSKINELNKEITQFKKEYVTPKFGGITDRNIMEIQLQLSEEKRPKEELIILLNDDNTESSNLPKSPQKTPQYSCRMKLTPINQKNCSWTVSFIKLFQFTCVGVCYKEIVKAKYSKGIPHKVDPSFHHGSFLITSESRLINCLNHAQNNLYYKYVPQLKEGSKIFFRFNSKRNELLVKSGDDVICLFDVRNRDVKYTLVPCAVVSSVDDIVEFSDLTYYN